MRAITLPHRSSGKVIRVWLFWIIVNQQLLVLNSQQNDDPNVMVIKIIPIRGFLLLTKKKNYNFTKI